MHVYSSYATVQRDFGQKTFIHLLDFKTNVAKGYYCSKIQKKHKSLSTIAIIVFCPDLNFFNNLLSSLNKVDLPKVRFLKTTFKLTSLSRPFSFASSVLFLLCH